MLMSVYEGIDLPLFFWKGKRLLLGSWQGLAEWEMASYERTNSLKNDDLLNPYKCSMVMQL